MRGKIRQWFVDTPSATTAAYVLMLAATVSVKIGLHDAAGATSGP